MVDEYWLEYRTHWIRRIVNLRPEDYEVIRRCARKRGYGKRGFSKAARTIIREWQAYQDQPSGPANH
jgi:hypothetical protein